MCLFARINGQIKNLKKHLVVTPEIAYRGSDENCCGGPRFIAFIILHLLQPRLSLGANLYSLGWRQWDRCGRPSSRMSTSVHGGTDNR